MRKFLFLLTIAAVATVAAGCQKTDDNKKSGSGETSYLSVSIATAPGTRAAGDVSEDYEEGLASENTVSTVRFYFFDEDGNAATVKTVNGTDLSYWDWNPADNTNAGTSMSNIEKKLNAVIVISTKEGDRIPSKMVAVVNPSSVSSYTYTDASGNSQTASVNIDKSLSLAELQKIVADLGNTAVEGSNGFIMTSSVYGDNGEVGCAVEIAPENLCSKEADALNNPVTVYVERTVAKVRLWTNMEQAGTDLYKAMKDEYDQYTDANGNNLYLKIDGWGVSGMANSSYLFKHINPDWSVTNLFGNDGSWNDADNFRSYWAANPESGDNFQLNYLKYSEITSKIGTKSNTTSGSTNDYDGDVLYCQENAADDYDNGTKSVVDGDVSSNRTSVAIAATITDADGNAVSLAKYANVLYMEDDAKSYIANLSGVYTKTTDASTGAETYSHLSGDAVEFKSAEDLDKADDNTISSKRALSYLQLTSAAESGEYYSYDGSSYKSMDTDAVNAALAADNFGVKVWKSGQTYYYADIEHLNTDKDTDDDSKNIYGQYGVVRNHIYDICISSIIGLGTPVLDPDKVVIPQVVEDSETYVAAQINILSWRLVKNTVNIDM